MKWSRNERSKTYMSDNGNYRIYKYNKNLWILCKGITKVGFFEKLANAKAYAENL